MIGCSVATFARRFVRRTSTWRRRGIRNSNCPGCGARGARSTSLDEALYFWLEGKRDPEDPRDTCECGSAVGIRRTEGRDYYCLCPCCGRRGQPSLSERGALRKWEQEERTDRKAAPPGPTEAFLYLLMRDHLPWGAVKDLIKKVSASPVHRFTDPHLEAAAIEFAKLLRGETNGQ